MLPFLVLAVVAIVVVAFLTYYLRKRVPRLRLMKQYIRARGLMRQPTRTAEEGAEVSRIRAACLAEWGGLMDPTVAAAIRLQLLPRDVLDYVAGCLDGTEEQEDLETYAEIMLDFIPMGWAAINREDWERLTLMFAQRLYDRYLVRAEAAGSADPHQATLDAVRDVVLHFFCFPRDQLRYTIPRARA